MSALPSATQPEAAAREASIAQVISVRARRGYNLNIGISRETKHKSGEEAAGQLIGVLLLVTSCGTEICVVVPVVAS